MTKESSEIILGFRKLGTLFMIKSQKEIQSFIDVIIGNVKCPYKTFYYK